jgi:hypothetical protein
MVVGFGPVHNCGPDWLPQRECHTMCANRESIMGSRSPGKWEIEMGVPAPAAYLPVTVEVPGYGKLSLAPQPNAPLLMVFGGIDVAERVIDPADKAHANQMIQNGG